MIPLRDNIPSRTTPFVNYIMIALCGVAFGLQLLESADPDSSLVIRFGMIPKRVQSGDADTEILVPSGQTAVVRVDGELRRVHEMTPAAPSAIPPLLTLFTCIFLHGGWMHFLGNMWFLYIFGDNVEDRFGHIGYAVFYIVSGVAASLAHLLTNLGSEIPTIGASGAIAGVMGAYLVLYPRAQVLSLVPIVYLMTMVVIPAPVFLGIWFLIQFFQGALAITSVQMTGVAWWAHIGGFAFGAAVAFLLNQIHFLRPKVEVTLPRSSPGSRYRVQHYRRPWIE